VRAPLGRCTADPTTAVRSDAAPSASRRYVRRPRRSEGPFATQPSGPRRSCTPRSRANRRATWPTIAPWPRGPCENRRWSSTPLWQRIPLPDDRAGADIVIHVAKKFIGGARHHHRKGGRRGRHLQLGQRPIPRLNRSRGVDTEALRFWENFGEYPSCHKVRPSNCGTGGRPCRPSRPLACCRAS